MNLKHGYSLEKIKGSDATKNWLFLPGGPGMGNGYIRQFVQHLDLQGTLWLADFPAAAQHMDILTWQKGLCELVKQLHPCVLVGHSFAGMLALTIPELENLLSAMALICTAPDFHSWQQQLLQTAIQQHLPDLTPAIAAYLAQPNAHTLSQLFIASTEYFFAPQEKEMGIKMLHNCQYDPEVYLWSCLHFLPTYKAKWVPQKLPTLLIGGEKDKLMPTSLFAKEFDFQRPNIKIASINGAGHFPWLTKASELNNLLNELT